MAKIGEITFKGESGNDYVFVAYPFDQEFKDVGAVYIVTKRTLKREGGGNHDVIYVGQTGSLPDRFTSHHKAACFTRNGANCICVHVENDEDTRLDIETDLCRRYSSAPCNG